MLTVQEGSKQLLSTSPGPLYFLTGPEYGVKTQYLDSLATLYENRVEERSDFSSLFESFKVKSLVPRKPTLYIVRYDDEFLKSLKADEATKIQKLNIVGTIIGIFDTDKAEQKLDKFFPGATFRVNELATNILLKYLYRDYPNIPEMHLKAVASFSTNYFEASHMCKRLSLLPENVVAAITTTELKQLFTCGNASNVDRFKAAIAARSYISALEEVEAYPGDISTLFYEVLNTMLEIIKVSESKYVDSWVTPYAKHWNAAEAKALFDETYEQINKLRNVSTYSPYVAMMYVCALLQFKLR